MGSSGITGPKLSTELGNSDANGIEHLIHTQWVSESHIFSQRDFIVKSKNDGFLGNNLIQKGISYHNVREEGNEMTQKNMKLFVLKCFDIVGKGETHLEWGTFHHSSDSVW